MPTGFRGEERFERLGNRAAVHARAAIGDCNHHVLTGAQLLVRLDITFVEVSVGGFDGELPTLGHGIARIDRKIENGTFKLVRIGQHPPETAGEYRLDRYRFAERAREETCHPRHESVHIHGFRLKRLAPRKREQLAGEGGRAPRPLLRAIKKTIEVAGDIRGKTPLVAAAPERTETAGYDLQKIVEVVCDPAGEL